jgi:phosphoesterase RecJ-like protein
MKLGRLIRIMLKNDVKEILELIKTSDKICIAGHMAPDGDCIGSVMALYKFLKPLNKNFTVMIDGTIPFNYKPFVDETIMVKDYDNEKFDLLFVLDTSDTKRLGKFEDVLNNSKKRIVIDHHKTNKGFGDINIIDPEMSSTGELLYDILKLTGMEITSEVAVLIYIAVLTDTGKFSYANTTSRTHVKTAELIDLGVNVSEIDNLVYNSKPADVVKAFIDSVSKVELYYENKLGIKLSTGQIAGILNSDDFYTNEFVIEKVVNKMISENADCLYADLLYVDEFDTDKIVRKWKADKGDFRLGWNPPHPTTFITKKTYDKFGLYKTNYKISSDYDLLYRIIHKGKVKTSYLEEYIVRMRVGGRSTSGIKSNIISIKEIYATLKENNQKFKLPIVILRLLVKIKQFI